MNVFQMNMQRIIYITESFHPSGLGVRIQPTFVLVRVVRGDLPRDIICHIPPVYCMHDLACSEAEFRQLGPGLSWFW